MRLYRIHKTVLDGTSCGYVFFSNKRAAQKEAREWALVDGGSAEVVAIFVKPTKEGIRAALNAQAGHADNG